jgi:hypothetical protein
MTAKRTLSFIASRTDSFPTDILPVSVPPLLQGLPDTDRRHILDECVSLVVLTAVRHISMRRETTDEMKILLTPEMIHAEFIEPHLDVNSNSKPE